MHFAVLPYACRSTIVVDQLHSALKIGQGRSAFPPFEPSRWDPRFCFRDIVVPGMRRTHIDTWYLTGAVRRLRQRNNFCAVFFLKFAKSEFIQCLGFSSYFAPRDLRVSVNPTNEAVVKALNVKFIEHSRLDFVKDGTLMERPIAPIKLFLDLIDHGTFLNFYKTIDVLRIKVRLNVKLIFK